jgi:hypothetical protein
MLFQAHKFIRLDNLNVEVRAYGQLGNTDRDVEHRLDSLDGDQDIIKPTVD